MKTYVVFINMSDRIEISASHISITSEGIYFYDKEGDLTGFAPSKVIVKLKTASEEAKRARTAVDTNETIKRG